MNKDGKTIQWEKNRLCNKWFWGKCIYSCQRINLNPYFTPYTKVNSKWVKHPIVGAKTTKLLDGNIGRNLCEFELVNGFLDKTPKIQTTKEKINLTLSNLEIFMLQRIIIKKMKTQSIEWEKSICKSYIWKDFNIQTI